MFEIFKKKTKQENNNSVPHESKNYQPKYLLPIVRLKQDYWLKFINEISSKSLNKSIDIGDTELSDIQYWTSLSQNDSLRVNVASYMYLELSNRLARIESLLDGMTQSKNRN